MNLNCSRVATVGLCSIILVISSVRQKSDSCSDFLTPTNNFTLTKMLKESIYSLNKALQSSFLKLAPSRVCSQNRYYLPHQQVSTTRVRFGHFLQDLTRIPLSIKIGLSTVSRLNSEVSEDSGNFFMFLSKNS